MIYKEFILRSAEGEKLRADIRYQQNGVKKPVIIFLHGFKGFKDWGPFPSIRERLALAGFISIAFNSSHNGIGDDLMNFTELDRFAENTISREIDEIRDVINEVVMLENIPIESIEINIDLIGLHGHSRGASSVILEASRHRMVRAIAAWAPPSDFNRYTTLRKDEWRKQGFLEIENSRTGQILRLNVSLLDDLEKHKERFDIFKAAHNLTLQEKPLLLIAGSEDLTVKPEESMEIYNASVQQYAELHIIPHTGHTFGAEHPKKEIPSPFEKVLELTINFFNEYLILHPLPFPE